MKDKVFKFKPERMANSATKYYCHICRWDCHRNHYHFDFTQQLSILSWEDSEKILVLKINDEEGKVGEEVECVCLKKGVDECLVQHWD